MHRRVRLANRSRGSADTEVEGLHYASSMHANREAVALCERARDALPERPEANMPLSHPGPEPDLERFAEELGYDLLIGPGTE